ncbi:hypothetical protein [Legionella sainthelensi]|uniref:XRE family transcriptional regulator n=1 Tax=Legionella sainthelensi TaxID=28087 RepID=A0A2H5FM83_9GAMM|nr:hypothetical protein [Legionella sainthelensi]AUH72665.1 hypothetical protein CAB17_11845 [Legionella sainthelensi]
MGCFTEISEPVIDIKFTLQKDAQRYLIDYILSYSELDCRSLADILGLNSIKLSQILAGKSFLDSEKAKNLFQYFIMMIGN